MPNFLNLKKKDPSDIVIVEKIVLKNRSMFFELSRMFITIAVASGIVWGISNANEIATTTANFINPSLTTKETKNFSAVGVVSNITDTYLSIDNAKSGDEAGPTSYTFDTSTIKKIESNHYYPLTLSQIQIGDNVIVQGLDKDGNIEIRRVIWYGTSTATGILTRNGEVPTFATSTVATTTVATTTATTTATSTLDVATSTVSTSSPQAASTTDSTSSTSSEQASSPQADATATPSLIDEASKIAGDILEKGKEILQKGIDTLTGNTTLDEQSSDSQNSTGQADTQKLNDSSSTDSSTTVTTGTDSSSQTTQTQTTSDSQNSTGQATPIETPVVVSEPTPTPVAPTTPTVSAPDRKSTRLNSSH